KPGCRFGSNINTELPKARVNAKVNLEGTKELNSNALPGSHSRDKGKTEQTEEQIEEEANAENLFAGILIHSGEASKKLIDVDVFSKDKQYPTKA
ncbi:unnamed protein product, partial [Ilex paraguariensis]